MIKILSLDGGGARGLFTIKFLQFLEQRVGKPIRDIFDVIGGVSIGGITSLFLTHPLKYFGHNKFTLDELIGANLHMELMDAHFGGAKKWYDLPRLGVLWPKYKDRVAYIQKFFDQKCFGNNIFGVGDNIKPTMVFAYDLKQSEIKVFKSWKQTHQKYPASIVARATSAAITYFPTVRYKDNEEECDFTDGGIVTNDASYMIVHEARKRLKNFTEPVLLVSIGTTEQGMFNYDSLSNAGMAQWMPKIVDLLFESKLRAVQYLNGHDESGHQNPTKNYMPPQACEVLGPNKEAKADYHETDYQDYYKFFPAVPAITDSCSPHNLFQFEKIAQLFFKDSLILDHLVERLKNNP